jgi:predicted N-formylglutamate amidohydrolase
VLDAVERRVAQHRVERRGLANVLIEIRQDLIDTQQGATQWSGRLAAALDAVLGDPALYRVEHY